MGFGDVVYSVETKWVRFRPCRVNRSLLILPWVSWPCRMAPDKDINLCISSDPTIAKKSPTTYDSVHFTSFNRSRELTNNHTLQYYTVVMVINDFSAMAESREIVFHEIQPWQKTHL